MEKMISLTIDGVQVQVPNGTTVLEAARQAGIHIPTLCFLKGINEIGACRMCVVDSGARALQAACVLPASDGMVVKTNTPAIKEYRKNILELTLSTHEKKCLSCIRSQNCELQKLCLELGVEDGDKYEGVKNSYTIDDVSPSIVRDNNKCVLCRRCVAVCANVQNVGVIGPVNRGFKTAIESPWGLKLAQMSCINCGQCIVNCPVGALYEKDDTREVWDLLADPDKHVVIQPAPAVRAALGEEFGYPMGTSVTGKMVTAMKRLGFDRVFDTDFGADLTIMEEANELVERISNGGKLPMITSCSPGWIKYCEHYYPDQLAHLSSCKSPQQMQGAIIKTYIAEKNGIDPKDIVSVSVMPCTAKKFEIGRDDQDANGVPDVDISITTRELARLIKRFGLDFQSLPNEEYDNPFGLGSGAGTIFGATGGVMEAALRTAVETITGETLPRITFDDVRGTKGIKTASYNVGGMTVKVCVASGLENARKVMEKVRAGEMNDYQFIEIMACPGGCVNGGGQPRQPGYVRNNVDIRALRAKVLYDMDDKTTLRKSHENPAIKEIYENFYGTPGSEKAHHLLHTSYVARKINNYTSD